MRTRLAAFFIASAASMLSGIGCGGDLGQAGDACISSAECATGLLCDTSLEHPVCALMGAPRPDLAGLDLVGVDLALPPGTDLAGADLSANQSVDMTQHD